MRISNNFQSPTQSNYQKPIQPNFQGHLTDHTKSLILRAAESDIDYILDNNVYRGPLDPKKLPTLIKERANKLIEQYKEYMDEHNALNGLNIIVIKKPLNFAQKAILIFDNPLAIDCTNNRARGEITKESEYIAASGLDFFEKLLTWLKTSLPANNIDNEFINIISDNALKLRQLQKQNPKDKTIKELLQEELNNLNVFKNTMKKVQDDIPTIPVKENSPEPEPLATKDPIEIIKELFETKPKVTVPELSTATGLSRYEINKLLNQLVENGHIQKHGKTAGVYYVTKSPIEKIKELFETKPSVTVSEVLDVTGLSRYENKKLLNQLVAEGYIQKRGSAGHVYYVTKDPIERIKEIFETKPNVTVPELSVATGFSRHEINKLLNQLVAEGYIQKHGKTTGVYYVTKSPIDKIKELFVAKPKVTFPELSAATGFSRHEINKLLNQLVAEGYIQKRGCFKFTHYVKVDKK